jgi:hypothetical protein
MAAALGRVGSLRARAGRIGGRRGSPRRRSARITQVRVTQV